MNNSLLEVRSLWKSFRSGEARLEILRGVDLSVKEGNMLAITGASGSGKSTLMHILGAMEESDSGDVRLGQYELGRLSREERAEFRNREIGFVFQFHHLLPEFTAAENVMMPLLLARQPFKESLRRAEFLLESVGLADRVEHRPGELSGGEQQRVAVARALVNQPRLLLADEPTGNLDEATSQQIQQLLFQLHRNKGLTSIIVTHDTTFAGACQSHLILQGGSLKAPPSTR